jgi:DNA-binding NarL/FixJ family response regulator
MEPGESLASNDPKRVLIADDHAAMLDEVRRLLKGKCEIVGAVKDGGALVEAAQRLKPDLIISDISMPVLSGFEAVAKIRAAKIDSRFIFLTVQSSAPYLKKARALGADGYVLKVYANEQLPTAVAAVLDGRKFFSPELNGA